MHTDSSHVSTKNLDLIIFFAFLLSIHIPALLSFEAIKSIPFIADCGSRVSLCHSSVTALVITTFMWPLAESATKAHSTSLIT